jgi:copper chaperone CopZ
MEVTNMEKLVLEIPTLWADHHVLKVRDALVSLEGVDNVYASAAWKQVLVNYDADKTDPATIEKALADVGYPVGEGEVPMLVQPGKLNRDPQWAVLGARVTETNMVDLEMSGEFRRY